ncbi:MAG: cell division protein FtsH, partial [Monoglobales bacterium]
ARKMVTKYCLSEKIGPITYGSANDEVFLGKGWTQTKSYSEELAAIIDSEVSDIIESCYNNTVKLLTENKDKLMRIADALLEFEKIDGPTFEKLFTHDESSAQTPSETEGNIKE